VGGNEEGDEGYLPSLTLVGDGLWRWLLGVGWLRAVVVGVAVLGGSGQKERDGWAVRSATGSGTGYL
jgi:hypothetical protein